MTDAQIIDGILRTEGWPKFTNAKADLGGPTKGGITLATLRVWRRAPALGVLALKALDVVEARAIYQFLYLQPFVAVADNTLRDYLVDLGVLRGPRAAAMMLQEQLGVTADGWIGPETLKALQTEPFKTHILGLTVGSRNAQIEDRVRANPSQRVYRKGWRTRNLSFLE